MKNNIKTGILSLPVFKMGDDLGYCIENNETLTDAFMDQAASYEEAANLCKKMAAIASEYELDVYAATHTIEVSGEENVIDKLIKEQILQEDEFEDECENDCECEFCEYDDKDSCETD